MVLIIGLNMKEINMKDWKDILWEKIKDEPMNTFKSKYLVTYWTERNDESTDVEIIIEALNETDAMKQFLDMNLIYRRIDSIIEMV